MSKSILIVSHSGDSHAYAVAEGLRRKGENPLLWHTPEFPARAGETVHFTSGGAATRITGLAAGLGSGGNEAEIDTVWYRRAQFRVDDSVLHPADVEFARVNCEMFRDSLLATLCPRAFWVNPHAVAVRSEGKLVQHHAAMKVGFSAPDTLFSNDPDEIRAFIRRQGGRIVYKPIAVMFWRVAGNDIAPYTSIISEDDLVDDDLLRAVPGIYQAIVPKAYELRITAMGHRITATRILSQETASGKLDWRKAYHELTMEPAELPADVRDRCIELMEALGLVFGCFDVVVTPAGEHVFLEVNQMGQFLFLEKYTQQPLLDMFCEFVRQGRVDFDWEETPDTLHLAEVRPDADAWRDRDRIAYPPPPHFYLDDGDEPAMDGGEPATNEGEPATAAQVG